MATYKRLKSRRIGPSTNPAFPSPIKSHPAQSRIIRYRMGSSTTQDVTVQDMLRLIATGTASSTTKVLLFDSVRLDRVCAWGVDSTAAQSTNLTKLSLRWGVGVNGVGNQQELVTYGTNSSPAHISAVPPTDSLSGFWLTQSIDNPSTTVLFTLDAPVGSVVDIHFTYVLGDATSTVTGGSTSANNGVYYYSIGQLVPADLPTYT